MQGFKFERYQRYEGDVNSKGQWHGKGREYVKNEGYYEVEKLLYEGSFKNGERHGHGVLYYQKKCNLEGKEIAEITKSNNICGPVASIPDCSESKHEVVEGTEYIGDFYRGFNHGSGTQ